MTISTPLCRCLLDLPQPGAPAEKSALALNRLVPGTRGIDCRNKRQFLARRRDDDPGPPALLGARGLDDDRRAVEIERMSAKAPKIETIDPQGHGGTAAAQGEIGDENVGIASEIRRCLSLMDIEDVPALEIGAASIGRAGPAGAVSGLAKRGGLAVCPEPGLDREAAAARIGRNETAAIGPYRY